MSEHAPYAAAADGAAASSLTAFGSWLSMDSITASSDAAGMPANCAIAASVDSSADAGGTPLDVSMRMYTSRTRPSSPAVPPSPTTPPSADAGATVAVVCTPTRLRCKQAKTALSAFVVTSSFM